MQRACVRVCVLSTFSNISSETTGPIETKFHLKPLWDEGTKVSSNGPCHMTQMAAMPIYGKNLKKSSSLEPKVRWPWNLVCIVGCSSFTCTKFVQMMTLGWPWPILRQGWIWSLMLLYGEKVKQWSFSETIVVYDVKVGRCSLLNDYINLYEYQRARSFIVLGPRSLRFNILFIFFFRNR